MKQPPINKGLRFLILEDNPSDVEMILHALRKSGYAPVYSVAATQREYQDQLNDTVDVILSDYTLPQFDAPHALAILQQRGLDIPFIVISGTVGEDSAVAVMRNGASDYLLKDRLQRLGVAIENAVKQQLLRDRSAKTEDALKKMMRAVEQSADSIVITDQKGIIEYVNPAFLRNTGYTQQEVLGRSPSILKSGKHDEQFYSEMWKTITSGKIFRSEFVNKKRSGELFYEIQGISPVFDSEGKITNYISTGKDITQQKIVEQRNEMLSLLGYRLSSSETSLEAANIVTETADNIFGWDACTVDLYSRETDSVLTVLSIDTINGEKKVVTSKQKENPPMLRMKKVIAEGAVLILRESEEIFDAETKPFGDTSRPSMSLMFVPIRGGGETIGLISIQSYTPQRYTDNDLLMLQSLADQCGAAFIRIHTQEQLKRSEANLLRAQRIGNIGSWYVDLGRNTLEWSDEVYHIFGKDPNKFAPSNDAFFACIHPEDRDAVAAASAESIRTGKRYEVEHRIIVDDGSIKTVMEHAEIILDNEQRAIAMHGVVQDVTDLKVAERALKSSEAKYRDIVSFAPVGIYQSMRDGSFLMVNKTLAAILGYDSENELMQKNLDTDIYYDPAERARLIGSFEPLGFGTEVEVRWKKKDGSPIWMQLSSHAIKNSRGETKFFEGFVHDITKRKQVEEALKQSEARYRTVIDGALDAIFTLSNQGKFTSLNPAFEKITGWKREQWIGKEFVDIIHADDLASAVANFRSSLQSIEVPVREYRVLTATGDYVSVEILTSPKYADGEVAGVFGVARDITERKRLESQFRQAQKMESIGTLAGGIAHDFNNILGILLGYIDLFSRVSLSEEQMKNNFETMRQVVHRGTMLVRQILTFARKNEMQAVLIQPNDVIAELIKMLDKTLPKTIEIVSVLGNVPIITIDPSQLHQALLNLCVNARDTIFDRMAEGSTIGKITIVTSVVARSGIVGRFPQAADDQYVLISVTDTGKGMDKSTMQRIFDPFFTTKDIGKGTGLGLSVVYGAVHAHHGFIDVESTVNVGTTFLLYFPVRSQPAPVHDQSAKPETLSTVGNETILLIEDEESLSQLMTIIFEEDGYTVLTAFDGLQGVEMFEKNREKIQIIVSDIGLPLLDGVQTIKKIKEIDPNVKVLLTSGFLEPFQREEIHRMGIPEVTQKPYGPETILRKVREILDAK